jgi:hypothetical protein
MPTHHRTIVVRPGWIGYLQLAWAILVETIVHPFSPSVIEVIRREEEGRLVRLRADELPETTPEELARVRALMDDPIDTSDIPETGDSARCVRRDTSGRIIRELATVDQNAAIRFQHVGRWIAWEGSFERFVCAGDSHEEAMAMAHATGCADPLIEYVSGERE